MTGLTTHSGRQLPWRFTLPLISLLLGWGCSTVPLPAVNLAESGWAVKRMEAVWTPRSGAPELTGEVTVASHPTEGSLVLFSKQGLPMVTARTVTNSWTLASPLKRGAYGGRGQPPRQVPWFLLIGSHEGRDIPKPWHVEVTVTGWQISNSSTGEKLEVVP